VQQRDDVSARDAQRAAVLDDLRDLAAVTIDGFALERRSASSISL
jgi:hypothetical protein